MAKLVQWVTHKPTGEKRLIKSNRFNPEFHQEIKGTSGEKFSTKKGKNSTAAGIVVPTGTPQPVAAPLAPSAAEVAAREEKIRADAKAEAKAEFEAENKPVVETAESLDENYLRRDLNTMAIGLGYPEKEVTEAPNKAAVIAKILAGKYEA